MAAQPATVTPEGVAERFSLAFTATNSDDFEIERKGSAIWCTRRGEADAHVSFSQLEATLALDQSLLRGNLGAIKFKIIVSAQPGIFSLGGDLAFFLRCIEQGDRASLSAYGLLAARAIWANLSRFGPRQICSIAVVEGEAQGGGFEAALSCDILIAERGAFFGFPETLFGLFPGMGGATLLKSRLDESVADKILQGANRYSAEFLFDIGVVDHLVPRGDGRKLAENLTSLKASPHIDKVRRVRRAALTFGQLATEVDHWVDTALVLTERNLRAMRYLLGAQRRRV